jgi:hypothetical protein
VNYGGDDYGDEDDYDYDYDPPPPPAAKPTGLRQQGQALQGPAKADSLSSDNKNLYGELPPLPGANQPSHNRSHSFDPEDEKRNFSSATMRQPSPSTTESPSNPPATQFSQMTGLPPSPAARNVSGPPLQISTQSASQPPPAALRKSSQVVSPVSGSPHPDILNVGRVDSGESSFVSPTSDARTPTSDYHTRRDFSPSAVPQPLTTRSPAPQSATDSPSTNFPPRKSSISQAAGPDLADTSGPSQAQTASKPWSAAPRSSSPGAAARSPGAPASKALPIIRPVDIYRRMEEERQKERQSMESGRPSMDSIVGAKASERSESPAKSNLRDSSTDSLGQRRSRASLETDDGSESGRQRPVLEPVKERKSEHDFEGFNVNEQNTQPQSESHREERNSLEQHHLDVEEVHRYSTSPKLPDLNRISGFGMDLFSPSKPEDSYSVPSKDKEVTPSGPPTSANTEDFTLHTQPTFGFRSVVNQTFDRTEDSSVPNTPASQPASGPSRSVSESTGTDGISPIMSRVPSAAVQNRNRDPSNPSKLQVVNEPDSLEEPSSQQESEGPPSGFRPGYRREISTPSRENSPARHPDLAKTNIITSGQHAVVSETSPDEEPLQPPRPIVDREQSFRPVLPGGWTSYATSATSDVTSQAPIERKQTPISRKQTPVIEATPIEERRQSDDYDITPTTTRNHLPKSASSAAVAGALGSIAGAALGKHDKSSPIETPAPQSPRALHSNKDLPTPDPVGNLYSMANVDPRLPPKLEQAPPETQLRPDAVHRDNSDESSVAPPPLPKDTPKQESLDNDSDYFPKPTVPLKQRTLDEAQSLELPQRTPMVPTLSSDTRSYDEETDKLRKEIVKSLSRPTTADQHRGSMMVGGLDDGPSSKPGHESTYLPSEYDNYWASTGENEEPVPAIARRESNQEALHHSETVSSVATEHSVPPEVNSPVIAPLSPRRPEAAEDYPRPSLPQRFSWEEGSEDVSIPQVESTPMGVTSAANNHPRETTNTVPATVASADSDPLQSSPVGTGPGSEGGDNRVEQKTLSDHHFGRDAALVAGGAAAIGAAAVTEQGPKSPPTQERRLSLAEEKDPRVSSYPVSPTPPEDEHPANSPAPYLSPFTTEFTHAPSSVSAGSSPAKAPLSPSGSKLYAFKEIVNMQSPQQRIRAFEETRHRWANMDSGLNNWMTTLQAQYPEHASASGAFTGSRVGAPVGSARSKFSKAPGGGAQPLQEPYYQHYLNASPTTPSTPTRPGPAPGAPSFQTGSQQGFSPAGNKLTTQQVQAKGKEFLHSAGIFGGKAGKAGKGLLAKGKNKLRGAGGGDKVD